jgi:UDP-N-acetylglucosamine diphosphorylase / glucose-1-phosphate thymidylyltransferase / UDP-N-acetylgalactosamine diphosphorylase / glucosamine-1-phosphate N-acetyltransferase / galactosamine-1-phosphate N-acetyltransferase
MKQAVILAAGEGQRLRPFTVTRPKVMLFIAGKPILQYVVKALAQNGIRDIIIVVGYRREQLFDHLDTGRQFGVDITYVAQERQLGTAHALAQARDVVKGDFLLLPGDNLIEPETIAQFVVTKPDAVLVKSVENTIRYGVATIEDGVVRKIQEKPKEATGNLINTGIYSFTHGIFDYISSQLDIPDMLNAMLADGHKITAVETEGTWLDAVYPWDIIKLNDIVIHRIPPELGGTIESGAALRGVVSVGKHSIIRSNTYIVGPVVIGENCDIGPNVCLMPATCIGHNVVIAPFSEIENSVIGDDVNIGPGSIIQDSVIDKGCVIKGHFTACSGEAECRMNDEYHQVNVGAMLGVNCSLGNSVVAQPGVMVGNYSQVHAMKLISGRLPDRSLVL